MNIHPETLTIIYQQLAEKLSKDELVKDFAEKYPSATAFNYRSRDGEPSKMRYFVKSREYSIPVETLYTISIRQEFLDRILSDAEELINLSRKNEEVLDSYLDRIKDL